MINNGYIQRILSGMVLRYRYELLAFHLSGVLIILGISLFNIFLSALLPELSLGKQSRKHCFMSMDE